MIALFYGAGAGFVQHKDGRRLDRDEALRSRAYHERVAADPNVMPERQTQSAELVRQIDKAIATTWPEQKAAAE